MSGFHTLESNSSVHANETGLTATHVLKIMGRMLYIMDPKENAFKDMDSIPEQTYIQQTLPYFFTMIILEWIVLILKGKTPRLSDGMMNVAHGLIMSLTDVFTSGFLFGVYLFIHRNFCIYELPWDSTFTWIVAAIGVDFGYYWVHRAAHEINLLWAAHQVHHSSEDYNLSTALRQSVFQAFGSWPFYLPLAFFIPPQHVVVHHEFNLLYQFWIHTEVVKNIGFLENILNTASHHRVHHGANRYCLDKNYAGVLIIWDRMFGTFEWERSDIKIVYGLVDQPQFFNPISHQLFYYGKVLEKARSMDNWMDFFFAFVKGPGWFPGTERLGDITFVPEEPVRDVYAPKISPLLHVYTVLHFIISIIAADLVVRTLQDMEQWTSLLVILYIIGTLTSLGVLYDGTRWAWIAELSRCMVSLVYLDVLAQFMIFPPHTLQLAFTGSAIVASACLASDLMGKKEKAE
ncbi:alkylglycerol monooxygenase [Eurytemora carolleeae]|uniref:alkylglycerol monooxygenase n=1 Tax=Eurytemora carolleeae TaxID=1294199 RepID=UPI000C77464F|nr:alkylglycerol monooxygenase [Eurytemora carolleeae]|eukprot:XP_023332582.1 alkylglycerol monooxygenase-like [Eurytemora affinis]